VTGYEEIRHTADVSLRAWGKSLEELFALAAEGMFSLIGEPDLVEVTRQVELSADDVEALLVDWLNELLYLSESMGELYAQFSVAIQPGWHLEATARGGPGSASGIVIKAATYHGLSVERKDDSYTATIVFDT